MTTTDLPPRLDGPRLEPDKPKLSIEINCICGRVLDAATYLDGGLVKLVVIPCPCGMERR